MPDDMLEDAIQISKKAMDEHDFEEHGVDVSAPLILSAMILERKFQLFQRSKWANFLSNTDSKDRKRAHGSEVRAVLARVPRQVVRVARGAREESFRLLHLRS